MKRSLLSILLLAGLPFLSQAQVVQWASKVIEFSSELTPVQYSAQQVLGKPNVLPAGGQSPNAWSPEKPKRKEFIKLGFANAMSIRQIAIAESHNPSAIYRVLAYDNLGKEHVVNTLNPMVVPLKGRMLNLFMEMTPYKVVSIKIEFDGAAVPDYFGIDAVAISDSNYPIIADIQTMQMLASGIVIEALDKNVNSQYSELNPLLSPDGKTLYFSRKNHPENIGGTSDKEDIWYSELDSAGHWQLAKNMGRKFNNEGPNFMNTIQAVTPDGKSAIVLLGNRYLNNGKMQAGVSISSNVGGEWTRPVALNIKDDYNYNEKANFFLTNNRKTLIMSVERDDTHGDRDLYVSFMVGRDSTWTAPLNLGEVVNTAGEESAPFLASDDKTLYFSSKGFSGYGGSDIYVTRRLDDTWTNWSEPENLGPEINSPLEDLFFNIPASSEYAYYSRGVSDTNTDIFRIKLPIVKTPEPWVTVKGKIVDKDGKPVGAKIVYERLPDGKELGIAQSNPETGEYEIRLPAGHNYGVRAEADGKVSESQNLDLTNAKSDQVIDGKDFDLEPIKVAPVQPDITIVLNNVFFDFDKTTLKPESFPELNRIVALMTDKPGMQIEIAGHADAIGTEEYNLGLSERRAKAVAKYLADKGISKDRITAVFFGEANPVGTNDTPAGRKKNRRVEFKILKL